MPVLNYLDETYTVRITVGENSNEMWAVFDTAMSETVIETTSCTSCGTGTVDTGVSDNGLSVDSTAASGTLNNPDGATYTGFEGDVTLCIYATGDYSTTPSTSNIGTMPCIQNMNVHFADDVTDPNANAVAYLGLAPGAGADAAGNTPDSTDLLMDQFETAGKFDSTSK